LEITAREQQAHGLSKKRDGLVSQANLSLVTLFVDRFFVDQFRFINFRSSISVISFG
jgi:hypothetical protein